MPIVLPNRNSQRNYSSDSVTKLESDTCNATLGAEKKSTGRNSRYRITFLHYRHRRIDPDNLSGKAALDGLVLAKVLPDDSAKCVEEVRHRQIKIKTDKKEYTKVIVERIIDKD